MINVAVFCGSARDVDERYMRHAFQVGRIVASRGHALICGGGSRGMTKHLVDGFLGVASSADAVSVVSAELAHQSDNVDARRKIVVHESLGARKEAMLKMSELAVVLPGGLGTLDEFVHLLAMRSIKDKVPSVVVCDYWGDFAGLFDYFHKLVERKFAREQLFQCDVVHSDDELIDRLATFELRQSVSR